MKGVTLKLMISISAVPNFILACFLLYAWATEGLYVFEVWRSFNNFTWILNYIFVPVILYLGLVSWLCYFIVAVSGRSNSKTIERILGYDPSARMKLFWIFFTVIVFGCGVPYLVTRAHTTYSLLLEFNETGSAILAIFTTSASFYGLVWNVYEGLIEK